MYKRILALFTCICLSVSIFLTSAYADYSSADNAVTYWDKLLADIASSASNSWVADIPVAKLLPNAIAKTASQLDSDVCAVSSDGYHHTASLAGADVRKTINGTVYAACTCSECGHLFRLYGKDFQYAYDQYLADNNKSGTIDNSDGSYLLSIPLFGFSFDDVNFGYTYYCRLSGASSSYPYVYYLVDGRFKWWDNARPATISQSGNMTSFYFSSNNGESFGISTSGSCIGVCSYKLSVDKPSKVSVISDPTVSVSAYRDDGVSCSSHKVYSDPYFFSFIRDSSHYYSRSSSASISSTDDFFINYVSGSFFASTSVFASFSASSLLVKIEPLETSPSNLYGTKSNLLTIADKAYKVSSYDYDKRSYTTEDGDTITLGDEYYTITDSDGNSNNYYYYITVNGGDSGGSGSGGSGSGGSGSGSGGSGDTGSGTDYSSILNSMLEKITDCLTRLGLIDTALSDVEALIPLLKTNQESSFALLQLVYNSLQLIQTDVNTAADTAQSILNVARDVLQQGELTNEKLDDVAAKLQALIDQGDVTNEKLTTIIGGLYDKDSTSWLQKIYLAIIGRGSDDEASVDTDDEEEVDTGDFIKMLKERLSFIFDVRDVFEQLIADVTSDAGTAQALSDGEITTDDIVVAHAETSDDVAVYQLSRASYTAPEVAAALGSSDKYGVDWGSLHVIDLSWYAQYKSQVDDLLSGFLWLGYCWIIIKRLPGIISGGAMITEDIVKIERS